MAIIFREFDEKDTDRLKPLLDDLVISEAATNKLRLLTPKPEYKDIYFNNVITKVNNGKGRIIVAEDGDKLVGYIIGTIEEIVGEDLFEFKPAKEGFITDIFVKEEYRRQGIAEKLMNMIIDFFEKEECDYVKLYTQASNHNAQNLYRKEGFSDYNKKMVKILKKAI
jgi:ribosomal protein S18 acetylase RimI-like enzyme